MSKTSPDLAGALAAMRAVPLRGRGHSSSAYQWLHARHDALAAAFAESPPSWQALADYLEIEALSAELDLDKGDDADEPKLLHGFLVRKAEKTHGTGRRLEGFLKPGASVVIVDDVCTTGGSTITAIEAAREAGMNVAGVLCLVDREQGGRAHIEAAIPGVPFLSVFTATDVRTAHIAQQKKAK